MLLQYVFRPADGMDFEYEYAVLAHRLRVLQDLCETFGSAIHACGECAGAVSGWIDGYDALGMWIRGCYAGAELPVEEG